MPKFPRLFAGLAVRSARGRIGVMIITIDGPAGSGKSTVARKLAARLEIPYLDTGAMYRAVAYSAMTSGVDFQDEGALTRFARGLKLEVDCGPTHTRVRVNGHDVSEALRDPTVSDVTPFVARVQAIRDLLVEMQRNIGRSLGALVTEGRDQGSVVFPYADVRFVLDASVGVRAMRRFQELIADGHDVTLESVRDNLIRRDAIDAKQWAPLLESGAARVIDTTHMNLLDVVDALERIVREECERRKSPC